MAPIVAAVRIRLVIAWYPPALVVSCVKAIKTLTPTPSTATPNHARTTFGCTPEASMAILRVVANTILVSSKGHGSSGAAIEKNTAKKSRTKTTPKRFSILVPYRAHSSATLTALGADEIVMTEMSELGPVDPSRAHPLLPKDELAGGDKPLFISVQDLRHVLDFLKREMGEDLTPDAAAMV